MQRKIRVGVVFGGRSAEHEISLLSAKNVIEALDKNRYEPVLIGIDKSGEWHVRDAYQYLLNADNPKKVKLQGAKNQVALVAHPEDKNLVKLSQVGLFEPLDVIFPVLHGTYGEDGAIQGLLRMAGVPFVGPGILGSAVGMDKDVMKRLMRDAKLNTAKFISLDAHDAHEMSFEKASKELGLPIFIKPANLGSSVGVSKVKNQKEYQAAVDKAFLYDRKILLEEFIDGREIECSIMGDERPIVSLPGEVIPKDDFHSYEAKYIEESGTVFVLPAAITAQETARVQEASLRAYKVLCCEGMARVDLFLKKDGTVYVNEINTIPGFTSTSMFPKLWEISGVPFPQVVDRLIDFALKRAEKEKNLKTTFA
ncbi:MAG: D-alanine--D-alanine ligase [Chlamydiales bacterium]|nr:D-alanine--D-alanine ligase [Chlamydiales bacterium]